MPTMVASQGDTKLNKLKTLGYGTVLKIFQAPNR